MTTGFVSIEGNPEPKGAELVWYEGPHEMQLRACVAPSLSEKPRGSVIIFPGRTEFIEKYFEVARDLQSRGFAIAIFDWPGQGLSDRQQKNRLKGHIDRFDTFTGALDAGLQAIGDRLPKPYVTLAHSMGGAIALRSITKGVVDPKAAAFSAPMWGIKGPPLMETIAGVMGFFGMGGAFVNKPSKEDTFEGNPVTHDETRWKIGHALIQAKPELALGPPTWGWLRASLDIVQKLGKPKTLQSVKCPVLVASAAEEKLVDNASHAQNAQCLPDVKHITIEGAMHEILMERDPAREAFWKEFDELLARAGV